MKIKVLHLAPRFDKGGAGRVISNLSTYLPRYGVESLIACQGGNWTNHLDELNLSWRWVPLFPSTLVNAVRSFFFLRKLVAQDNIGLIHSHHRFPSLVGRMVARSLQIPFVCTVHDLADGRRLVSRIALGDTIIVHSQAVKSHLVGRFGVKPEWIHLIPMGTSPVLEPTLAQRIDLRRQTGCSLETPLVIFVGRLSYEKGPELFLQAIPQVLSRFPNARFWVLGDGELGLELESLAGSLGIGSAVTFWGWRDDSSLLMGCADLVVVPSRSEGFGKVALEALMLGKPVVAAQVGGLCELVQHEQNGLLIPPGQPTAIAEAIIRLISKPDELLQMGARAREGVAERFSQEAMLEGVATVYEPAMVRQQRKRL